MGLNPKCEHYFIPVFRLRGKRWRIRFRFIHWKKPKVIKETFPEGTVYTVFACFILIIAMID